MALINKQVTGESAVAEWNQCMNLIIAYHMARIYRENIAQKMRYACAAIAIKTKSPIIYDFCMKMVICDSENQILDAINTLQEQWEIEGIM